MPSNPRVLSLLPSATEVLCAIGASELLVGRSHECDFPPSILDRPTLTRARALGTTSAEIDASVRTLLQSGAESLYAIDEEIIRALRPDVILTQSLCEVCSIDLKSVERLAESLPHKPQIISLNPMSVFDVFDDILRVGEAVDRHALAEAAMVKLRDEYWSAIDFVNPYVPGPEVLFLEWMDPIFVGGHWTPQLIETAGGRHALNLAGAKSRQVAPEDVLESMPSRIIIAPCGLSIDRIREELDVLTKTRWWPLLPAVLDSNPQNIVLVDGNQMFNRPGPRLVDAFRFLVGWLNNRQELIPKNFPFEVL